MLDTLGYSYPKRSVADTVRQDTTHLVSLTSALNALALKLGTITGVSRKIARQAPGVGGESRVGGKSSARLRVKSYYEQ